MACEKCTRSDGHTSDCEIVAPFIADANEIIVIKNWPNRALANVASYLEKRGYPSWYRPIAERPQ